MRLITLQHVIAGQLLAGPRSFAAPSHLTTDPLPPLSEFTHCLQQTSILRCAAGLAKHQQATTMDLAQQRTHKPVWCSTCPWNSTQPVPVDFTIQCLQQCTAKGNNPHCTTPSKGSLQLPPEVHSSRCVPPYSLMGRAACQGQTAENW